MKTPIKDVLKWVQEEGEIDESASFLPEAMEGTEEDLSASMRVMSISGDVPADIVEEFKHEFTHEKIYGIDRLIQYKPEETLKTIIEKIIASPDKRLICMKRSTREIAGVISVTNIFTYVTT